MKTNFLVVFTFLFTTQLALSQTAIIDHYKAKILISQNDTLPYRILAPRQLEATKKYPLVLFLHGSGERGRDNQLQLVHGASFFASDSIQNNYEAFVVFPQCDNGKQWSNYEYDGEGKDREFFYTINSPPHTNQQNLMALVDYLQANYPIDSARLYVGGLSMGGMGTLELLKRNPNTFAAAFAICGGADPKSARKIKKTPVWLFHGEDDTVVPARYSIELFKALLKKKAQAKLTIYPKTGHDSWTATFKEPGLLDWLFSHSKE
jgi:predicted peptidase